MFQINHRGQMLEYCFLRTDSSIAEEDRERLVIQTFDAYLDKKKSVKIRGKSYEGRITTNSRYYILGSFGGQQFEILLETNDGKRKLSCLVTKLIDSILN